MPLSLLHFPFCVTFSTFTGAAVTGAATEEIILLDATRLEEQLSDGAVTISMNKHGEVCQISKLGGAPIDAVTLLHCTNVALVKVKEFSNFVSMRLKEDAKKRDNGGLLAELSAENAR